MGTFDQAEAGGVPLLARNEEWCRLGRPNLSDRLTKVFFPEEVDLILEAHQAMIRGENVT